MKKIKNTYEEINIDHHFWKLKCWLIWKDPDSGKDWGREEKGTKEDEIVGWHHQPHGHEFGWIPGVGDGQGGLACCDSWGRKESDTTERLNWTELASIPPEEFLLHLSLRATVADSSPSVFPISVLVFIQMESNLLKCSAAAFKKKVGLSIQWIKDLNVKTRNYKILEGKDRQNTRSHKARSSRTCFLE